MSNPFDGVLGDLAGMVMARMNAAAEIEAVRRLHPAHDARVIVIGYGPGVGVQHLLKAAPQGFVLGLDPSSAMLRQAARRNRAALSLGRVRLEPRRADELSTADGEFDGALAVNSLQMCQPLSAAAKALAARLHPGARLVSLTHDWALARRSGVTAEAFLDAAAATFAAAGFGEIIRGRGEAEKGRIVLFEATKL